MAAPCPTKTSTAQPNLPRGPICVSADARAYSRLCYGLLQNHYQSPSVTRPNLPT